jgi:hypothetical protein
LGGKNGDCPTYEICPCCGVEFGNEDYTLNSIRIYRENWIKSGSSWFDPKEKPNNWNLHEQLQHFHRNLFRGFVLLASENTESLEFKYFII